MYPQNKNDVYKITELPVKKWSHCYKDFLTRLVDREYGESPITHFTEDSTVSFVSFKVYIARGRITQYRKLLKALKEHLELTTEIKMSKSEHPMLLSSFDCIIWSSKLEELRELCG